MYGEKEKSYVSATAEDDLFPKLYGSVVRWRSGKDLKIDAKLKDLPRFQTLQASMGDTTLGQSHSMTCLLHMVCMMLVNHWKFESYQLHNQHNLDQ